MKKNTFKLIFLILVNLTVSAQNSSELSRFGDYTAFSEYGGDYQPGDFCVYQNKKLSDPIISKAILLKNITDQSLLKKSTPTPIPDVTFNKTKQFISDIKAKAEDGNWSAEAEYSINNIDSVKLEVTNGKKYHLANGKIVIRKILKQMSLDNLNDIDSELKSNKKIRLISGILEFSKGELTVFWNKNQSPSIGAKLISLLSLNAGVSWKNKGSVVITYNKPVRIGYKYWTIDKTYKKYIKNIINEKKKKNDTGSLMDKCINGSLKSCNGISKEYENYIQSVKEKFEVEYRAWEKARENCKKSNNLSCLNDASLKMDAQYQNIAILNSEIERFKLVKDNMYNASRANADFGKTSDEYVKAKSKLQISVANFKMKMSVLDPIKTDLLLHMNW